MRTTGRPTPRVLSDEAKQSLVETAPAGMATVHSPAPAAPPQEPAAAPQAQPAAQEAPPRPPSSPAPERPVTAPSAALPRGGRRRRGKAEPKHPFLIRPPESLWEKIDQRAAQLDVPTHAYILSVLEADTSKKR